MLAHLILDPSQRFLLSIDVANLVLGFCVLLKNPKHAVNQTFFIFVLGSVTWSSGVSLIYITHILIFDKLALGGGFLMLFGLTLFARIFPSESQICTRFYLIFIPLIIGAVCLPFNLFIQGILIDKDGLIQSINGPLFPFFVAITIGYGVAAIYFFAQSFRGSKGKARMQMLYLSTGIAIFIISLAVFDAILPSFGIYRFNLLGPASSFIFISLTSYAIVRHQFMDIRIIIQRGTIYTLLLSIIITSYLSILFVTKFFFDDYQEIADPLLDSTLMIFGILTIPRIERYFRKATNRFFFKDRYEYATALENLSRILNTNIQIEQLVQELLQALDTILHPESISFFHSATNTFLKDSEKETSSVKSSQDMQAKEVIRIQVASNTQNIGTFIFGPKRSGEPYTSEDLTLLRTFATQAAVSFEKAELYQELESYSRSLEQKVHARTKKLRKLQRDQRQLFDDISHALQTPLTILKGALELSKVDELSRENKTNEVMEQSIDDLSRLIREILQLARMDSIPTETEQYRFNLSSLVENVIEYVEVVCRSSGTRIISDLTLGIEMIGDEKQIEEAIINLLSNAVHHTADCPVREIRVTLIRSNDSIKLSIRDTGTGISADRISHIFKRFYRNPERDTPQKTGHGLGLAIVKRIIERHKGMIQVRSELGQGTEFTISFPTLVPSLIGEPGLEIQA